MSLSEANTLPQTRNAVSELENFVFITSIKKSYSELTKSFVCFWSIFIQNVNDQVVTTQLSGKLEHSEE